MADRESTRVRECLKSLFSDQRLNTLARATGFVQRQRVIKPVAFFWTLVLGFGIGSTRKISGLRRAYQRSTGTTLVPAQSKNSSGFPMVVLQEPAEPFAAANRSALRHAFL